MNDIKFVDESSMLKIFFPEFINVFDDSSKIIFNIDDSLVGNYFSSDDKYCYEFILGAHNDSLKNSFGAIKRFYINNNSSYPLITKTNFEIDTCDPGETKMIGDVTKSWKCGYNSSESTEWLKIILKR